jgi:hypothetical protein
VPGSVGQIYTVLHAICSPLSSVRCGATSYCSCQRGVCREAMGRGGQANEEGCSCSQGPRGRFGRSHLPTAGSLSLRINSPESSAAAAHRRRPPPWTPRLYIARGERLRWREGWSWCVQTVGIVPARPMATRAHPTPHPPPPT